jgi:radical SAM superfamily enzyme YgiQ (UPF0313 family)
MRVACVIPPYIPSYFNAGHHLPVFQVAAYLRARGEHEVEAVDCAALNSTWRDVCRLLAKSFDAILLLNDYDAVDGIPRFVAYAREISPSTKLATFGRASRDIPGFFDRFGLDAIGASGDYEVAMAAFLDHIAYGAPPHNLRIRIDGDRYETQAAGPWLSPEDWILPDVTEIPYAAYARLYEQDLNKFCGIPNRKELVVPVARGCPVGCKFCDVPRQQGLTERRLPVDRVVQYIATHFYTGRFEYVSFYAPTFTLKRNWVKAFCAALSHEGLKVPWKCVTTVAHLDADLIQTMRDAGCVRISVGVESFASDAQAALPQLKRETKAAFGGVAEACNKAGIELNCFLMLGLPGESATDAINTMQQLIADGHRVRPTVYTPYERMTPEMSMAQFVTFNRQIFHCEHLSASDRALLYHSLYAEGVDVPTAVQSRVPSAMLRDLAIAPPSYYSC